MTGRLQNDVWLRWEYDRLNRGFVVRTRPLATLLAEADPHLVTRDGDVLPLNCQLLERIAGACAPSERDRLRLPVTVHFSADFEDSAYVTDELTAAVLHRLEGWGEAYRYRDGRMWLPLSLATDLILRHEGVLQRLFL